MSDIVSAFIHDTAPENLPEPVIRHAQRCLLDLIGVAAGGSATELSHIIRNHAARHFGSPAGGARLFFDGRRVSPVGAALANGMTIDSMDAHDGHVLTKGHVGAAVLPALLAYIGDSQSVSGRAFLTTLVIGYETATRAGIALHRTACDYHTSGAWNTLACAAIGSRYLGLNRQMTREALGIAEYHGPRSQMMRCIDHPTMVKDGSGWGAMAGVSAAYLAADGFTGAPALTIEGNDVADLWEDLGIRWRITEQYFKPYPVCRWAQPAVEAALNLQERHGLNARDIARVEVFSFHEAIRLATRKPTSTEAAQYSLPFSVATALNKGRLGAEEVAADALVDTEALRLSMTMVLNETDDYNARFPAERWAHVAFELQDGRILESEPAIARGNPENALSDEELLDKYRLLSRPLLGERHSDRLEKAVRGLDSESTDMRGLLDELMRPVQEPATRSG